MTMIADPDTEVLTSMYTTMETIRAAEARLIRGFTSGEFVSPYYPVKGMEAAAAGVAAALQPDDYYVTTYRCLADVIAKGVPLNEVMGEILGRVSGTSKGKGGTMHISDPQSGLMVTTGIVGAGAPIAAGLALGSLLLEQGRVTAVSFGDGSTSIGAIHEALNLASIWSLPVVFVCHNNSWGECTPIAGYTRTEQFIERAAPFRIPATRIDGTDPVAVLAAATEAVDRARSGGGPTFIEAVAPRIMGHYFGDPGNYMDKDEVKAAIAADPVPAFGDRLVDTGVLSAERRAEIQAEVKQTVADAVADALAHNMPSIEETYVDVYADPTGMPR